MPVSGPYPVDGSSTRSPSELARNTDEIDFTSIFSGIPVTFPPVNSSHQTRVVNDVLVQELTKGNKTQRDLAELLGISESAVSRRLHGNYDWSISDLKRIGAWLGVHLLRIIDRELVLS